MIKFLILLSLYFTIGLASAQDSSETHLDTDFKDLSTIHCGQSVLNDSGQFSGQFEALGQNSSLRFDKDNYTLHRKIMPQSFTDREDKVDGQFYRPSYCDQVGYEELATFWVSQESDFQSVINIDFMDVSGRLIFSSKPKDLSSTEKILQFITADQAIIVVYRFANGERCSYMLSKL